MNGFKSLLNVEQLGDRALMSGFGFGAGFLGGLFTPSATVQADLAQLRTDGQQLQTDLVALVPTLQTDKQALDTATKAAFASDQAVIDAKTTLDADRATWSATLKADWQALLAATDATTRTAAWTQIQTDSAAAHTTLKADRTALQTALAADAGVAAATTQLQTDAAPIIADKAAIAADLAKLKADIQSGA